MRLINAHHGCHFYKSAIVDNTVEYGVCHRNVKAECLWIRTLQEFFVASPVIVEQVFSKTVFYGFPEFFLLFTTEGLDVFYCRFGIANLISQLNTSSWGMRRWEFLTSLSKSASSFSTSHPDSIGMRLFSNVVERDCLPMRRETSSLYALSDN